MTYPFFFLPLFCTPFLFLTKGKAKEKLAPTGNGFVKQFGVFHLKSSVIRELGNFTGCLDVDLFKFSDPRHCLDFQFAGPGLSSSSCQEHFCELCNYPLCICAPSPHSNYFHFMSQKKSSPRVPFPVMFFSSSVHTLLCDFIFLLHLPRQ